MFITGKNVYIRNENADRKVNGYNVDIFHYCAVNKSYSQFKVDTGRWIDEIGAHDFIVPRVVLGCVGNNVLLHTLNDFVTVLKCAENNDNECSDCPYSENCNGQMCFFAEV